VRASARAPHYYSVIDHTWYLYFIFVCEIFCHFIKMQNW